MIGIYVDRWRVGTKSEKEVDDMLSFCNKAGITDIFLHCHEDIAVKDDWDYFGYVLSKKGKENIHIWKSTTKGRDNPNGYTKNVLLKNLEYTAVKQPHGTVLSLDLTGKASKTWFLNRLKKFMKNHPGIYGIHLDKFLPTYGDVVLEVRKAYPDKYISVAEYGKKLPKWDVNEIIPMRTFAYSDISKETFPKAKTVGISIYACDLKKTSERLKYLKDLKKSPILFSYGAFSSNPRETRQDLVKVINATYK